jgi:hypothetical protein
MSDGYVARQNADGTPDANFGTDGIATTSVRPTDEDNFLNFDVQADGKIVVIGNQCGGNCNYISVRYNANKVGGSTGLLNQAIKLNSFSVYPNPSANTIHIETMSNQQIESVKISDINGKILSQLNGDNSLKISSDISHFLPGIYFVELTTNLGNQTQKFVKN